MYILCIYKFVRMCDYEQSYMPEFNVNNDALLVQDGGKFDFHILYFSSKNVRQEIYFTNKTIYLLQNI